MKKLFFSDSVPVYLFIHLKGQLMQIAPRNEIQEKISAKTVSSKLETNYFFLQKMSVMVYWNNYTVPVNKVRIQEATSIFKTWDNRQRYESCYSVQQIETMFTMFLPLEWVQPGIGFKLLLPPAHLFGIASCESSSCERKGDSRWNIVVWYGLLQEQRLWEKSRNRMQLIFSSWVWPAEK